MKKPNSYPKIVAALKLSKRNDARNTEANALITSCSNAPGIVWSTGLISGAQTARDDYDKKQTDAKQRIPGAPAERDSAWNTLYIFLQKLQGEAQMYADSNPDIAVVFLTQCGFKIRTFGNGRKLIFKVENGKVAGEVVLTGVTEEGVKTHEWQMSVDAITFTSLPSTTQGTTTVSGLPIASIRYFRHRWLKKTGYGNWSQIASIVVI